MGIAKRPSSSLLPKNNVSDASKKDFPITFVKMGRNAYEITLYASTAGGRTKWLEAIGQQQELLRTKGDFYNMNEISANFFSAANRVNCVSPYGEYSLGQLYTQTLPFLSDGYEFLREATRQNIDK